MVLNGQGGSDGKFDSKDCAMILPNHPCAVSEEPQTVDDMWVQTINEEDIGVPTHSESSSGSDYVRTARQKSHENRVFAFADIDAVKVRVRSKFNHKPPPYNVHNEYWETGIAQKIARSQRFENLTLGVIVINAVWIAIDTDENDAVTLLDARWVFRIADTLFFGYFAVELIIRFAAFQRKKRSLRDPWFVFDSSLVTLYFFDPFVMTFAAAVTGGSIDLPTSLLRLFRLFRLTRLVRMMRSLPELMILVKGMVTASASVSYTLGLLMIVTYIFAIAMAQLSIGTSFREQYFQGVALSMYTLLIYGTFLDSLAGFTDAVREESTICLMMLTVFAIISALTLMNMLVGVLCEVVSAIARTETEALLTEKVHETCCKVLEEIDSNHNNLISFEEMQLLFENKDAQRVFASARVNIYDLVDVAEDFLHRDGKKRQMRVDDFMNMVLDCRASKKATLKDVMVLRRRINTQFREFRIDMKGAEKKINALLEKTKKQKKAWLKADGSSPNLGDGASVDLPTTATPMFRPDLQEHGAQEAEAGHDILAWSASTEASITRVNSLRPE